jgi:hypothetical protein
MSLATFNPSHLQLDAIARYLQVVTSASCHETCQITVVGAAIIVVGAAIIVVGAP